jgi:hypothetical protein
MGRWFKVSDGSIGGEQFAFFTHHPTGELTRWTGGDVGSVLGIGGERLGRELGGDPLSNEVGGVLDVPKRQTARVGEGVMIECAKRRQNRLGDPIQFGGGRLGKWHGKQGK